MPKLRRLSSRRLTSGFSTVSSIADEGGQENGRDDGQTEDERRGEPIVLVAFLQHRLQSREADRHRDDAGPVAFFQQMQLHRPALQRENQSAATITALGTELMKKIVLPAVVLRQVAADGRPDGGREGDG